jgi:membrane fusion protein, heavy metal efflux system
MMCRVHLMGVVLLLALGAHTLAGCDRKATPSADAGVTPSGTSASATTPRAVKIDPGLVDAGRVRTVRVSRRAPTGVVSFPADVVASPEGSAEAGALLPGRVARFELREGDRVKRGQVLAWLDSTEAARAIADLVRARARTETQARKVARLEGLVASEAVTQVAVEDARLERDIARADLAAARTLVMSLGLAEPPATSGSGVVPALVAQLPVRSPVDGVIVARRAPLGGHVTPETPLFQIVAEGSVLVEARMADGSAVPPAVGTVAHVRPRGGARCAARVLGALPQVDAPTRSRKLRLALEGPCTGLVAGGQAEVEIEVSADAGAEAGAVLLVPVGAVVDVKAASVVFVAGRTRGTFDVRAVELGARIGDDRVVSAGLGEEDEVVVLGAVLLKGELMRSELGGEE